MSEIVRAVSMPPVLAKPIVTPSEMVNAHKELEAFVRDALEDGRDYGVIPGTNDKKNLLKPGAERLMIGFGLKPEFEILEAEANHNFENRYVMTKWVKKPKPTNHQQLKAEGKGRNRKDKDGQWIWQEPEVEEGTSLGLYRYVIRCIVLNGDGVAVGQGVGSCSSLESKYIRSPRDSENTVLKMAKKRAFIDATLGTLGLSDRFTQDVDDIVENNEARSPEGPIEGEIVHEEPIEPEPKPWNWKVWCAEIGMSKTAFQDFQAKCSEFKKDPAKVAEQAKGEGVTDAVGLFLFLEGGAK